MLFLVGFISNKQMVNRQEQFNTQSSLNLNNEDYIRKVLESGTGEELEAIVAHHKLSPEQVDIFTYYAKLRRKILEEMQGELAERKVERPIATVEEMSLGAYQENIEPPVRAAVMELRGKGYTTYESGFGGFDSQIISFEKRHLEDWQMPDAVRDKFKNQGVEIDIKPDRVRLVFKKLFNQEEINRFWQEIASFLPDLNKPAEPCQLAQAVSFRNRQASLRI